MISNITFDWWDDHGLVDCGRQWDSSESSPLNSDNVNSMWIACLSVLISSGNMTSEKEVCLCSRLGPSPPPPPPKNAHVTRAYAAHHPPDQTATCPIGLSKLTVRRRRTLKRTVCGAAAARPPHTESLSGTSLKWLAEFTEHFHLCAPPRLSHHYFDFAHMLRPSVDIHH